MIGSAGPGARVVSIECDPEVACLAMNLLEFAGAGKDVDVWIGSCEDVVPRLAERLGPASVDFVYMDHNQMIYHEDVARLEASGVLADGAGLVATQALKPGAPLLVWRLAEAQKAGRCALEIVSAPDCGLPYMEEWVVVARLHSDRLPPWEPTEPPRELLLLAAECNLMRWRTAQNLVDERRWNAFVQYVRRGMERWTGVTCTREMWPNPAALAHARKLEYVRLDY
eukprot:NODE_16251_length_1004_cov_6.198404.p1 GENE.NODE_16251_length_1004_cov_6.198404~~NODE_16251_length_1004_cov_6.198404.p1  ORF type:complete len:226 (-),score=71.94 NODE_16251_length_1004_cov_6.198404:242-919(-)